MKCQCKHKSHRGLCLRHRALAPYVPYGEIAKSLKLFDGTRDLCKWCMKGIHEDQWRGMIATPDYDNFIFTQ